MAAEIIAFIAFQRFRLQSRERITGNSGGPTWRWAPSLMSLAGKLQRLALLSPSRVKVLEETVDEWLRELDAKDGQQL